MRNLLIRTWRSHTTFLTFLFLSFFFVFLYISKVPPTWLLAPPPHHGGQFCFLVLIIYVSSGASKCWTRAYLWFANDGFLRSLALAVIEAELSIILSSYHLGLTHFTLLLVEKARLRLVLGLLLYSTGCGYRGVILLLWSLFLSDLFSQWLCGIPVCSSLTHLFMVILVFLVVPLPTHPAPCLSFSFSLCVFLFLFFSSWTSLWSRSVLRLLLFHFAGVVERRI